MSDPEHGYSRARSEFYHRRTVEEWRPDLDYYVERARAADGPVLEMACGTGRIYLPLLDVGVDADGFDRSPDALAVLRETAADVGLDPSVWLADMTAFAVDREYELVICPFNGLRHLLTVDDQLAALRRVHEALAPGGRFCFDVIVPRFATICEDMGEWRTSTVEYRGEPHTHRVRWQVVDDVNGLFSTELELTDPDGGTVFTEQYRQKMLPPRELELLARLSPFAEWSVTANFGDEPLEHGDAYQVWTLEKAAGE